MTLLHLIDCVLLLASYVVPVDILLQCTATTARSTRSRSTATCTAPLLDLPIGTYVLATGGTALMFSVRRNHDAAGSSSRQARTPGRTPVRQFAGQAAQAEHGSTGRAL